jgi:hypothetical protein
VKSRPWGGLKFKIIGWRTEIVAKEVEGLILKKTGLPDNVE